MPTPRTQLLRTSQARTSLTWTTLRGTGTSRPRWLTARRRLTCDQIHITRACIYSWEDSCCAQTKASLTKASILPPPRYLGAKEGGPRFLFDPFGFANDETLAAIWENFYLVVLFAPFLLACAYIALGQPALPSLPFDPFYPVEQGAGVALWISAQGMSECAHPTPPSSRHLHARRCVLRVRAELGFDVM